MSFFQDEHELLEFENVDIGSFWLTFSVVGGVVTGSLLLNNIAAFIDKCIIIRSHYLTIEKQKAELEKARIEGKQKEELINSLDTVYKITVKNAINELEDFTKYHIADGDERERVEQTLEKLGKLIDKGLQIYSTIESPEEIKTLFKPLEMRYLAVGEKLKLLEDKEDSDKAHKNSSFYVDRLCR